MAYNLSDFIDTNACRMAAADSGLMLIPVENLWVLRKAALSKHQQAFAEIERWAEQDLWSRAGWRR